MLPKHATQACTLQHQAEPLEPIQKHCCDKCEKRIKGQLYIALTDRYAHLPS